MLEHKYSLAALGLVLACAAQGLRAEPVACPSADLPTFAQAFASSPELQQAFSRSPMVEQRVVYDERGRAITIRHKREGAERPQLTLLAPQAQAWSGLQTFWEGETLVVHDAQGDVVQAFVFEKDSCWQLVRVEQWSMGDLLDQKATPGETEVQRQVRKAELFLDYGAREQYPLTTYFFELGQRILLDAARHGSANAAVQAVSLGYSGMAPELKPGEPEKLLLPYAQSDAEAALMLSMYYCDPHANGPEEGCQDPVKAEAVVMQALRKLDAGVLYNTLASALASGRWGTRDPDRAVACYQQALQRDYLPSLSPLTWSTSQGQLPKQPVQCLPEPARQQG
ncbi:MULTISPECIES: hypothetical protein [unclassified Pseudomonas]|uniref:hypothetical protein n=1 Tax=unclassified Pseudomonas TaxID=196821 RepID=UPI000A1F1EBB|nr:MULTISPECIES: hypothetical protein [unclassified Pseudomonas]